MALSPSKKLQLILASLLCYGLPIVFYSTNPYYVTFLKSKQYHYGIQIIMGIVLIGYLGNIFFFKKNIQLSQERVWAMWTGFLKIVRHLLPQPNTVFTFPTLSPFEQVSLRLWVVKAFFIPMMLVFFVGNLVDVIEHRNDAITVTVVNYDSMLTTFFPLILSFFYCVDVGVFIFGYFFESKKLGNVVRSVEPTALGWVVALACYTPFSDVTSKYLPSMSKTFSSMPHNDIGFFASLVGLVLMGIYTLASVNLGWKGSNLTHRGVVSHGVYAYVRHPAYAAKNTFWLIVTVPIIVHNFQYLHTQPLKFLLPLLGALAWAGIYYLRALTEERHLASVDGDYAEYMKKVRYRFIPGVW